MRRLAIQNSLKCTGCFRIFIHQHWYFIFDTGLILWSIELFIYIQTSGLDQKVGRSFFFSCSVGQPWSKIYLSDVSFHWYWTIGQTLMSRPDIRKKSIFNDWSVIKNQFNIVFYNKIYTIKNVSCWKKSQGGSIYNINRYDGQIYFHWYKILGLLYKRALFDLQFVHNLFWLKLKWNARWKLCLLYHLSFSMLWWSSRTLTKLSIFNDWSVIKNQFNIVFYNKIYTIKNVSCWKKSQGGSIYNIKLLSQNI
jgi:hypothetical protein